MSDQLAKRRLPDGWRWVRLGEVCEITMGQSPEGTSYNSNGLGVPLLNGPTEFGPVHPTPTQWTTAPTRFTEPGDILFCVRGATTGRMNLADQRYCIGRGLAAVRGKNGYVDTSFLGFLLTSVTRSLLQETAGSTFPNLPGEKLERFFVGLPPLAEQQRIAAILNEQMAAVERARVAVKAQLELSTRLIESYLRQSLSIAPVQRVALSQCLQEVSNGVGASWRNYRVVGATRAGAAPAKENVGKHPERYKLIDAGTIFYNPMRILLGSIGMIDDGNEPGITSPDYVVFKTRPGILHPRWFYHWLRSRAGDAFIKTLTRGAVRERMLFRRLAEAEIVVPPWDIQREVADKLKLTAELRRSVAEQLNAINKLPAALLREAFAGRP